MGHFSKFAIFASACSCQNFCWDSCKSTIAVEGIWIDLVGRWLLKGADSRLVSENELHKSTSRESPRSLYEWRCNWLDWGPFLSLETSKFFCCGRCRPSHSLCYRLDGLRLPELWVTGGQCTSLKVYKMCWHSEKFLVSLAYRKVHKLSELGDRIFESIWRSRWSRILDASLFDGSSSA